MDICPYCGEEDYNCICDEEQDDILWPEDFEDCGCPYCFCSNQTEHGVVCSDCLSGAHQG